MMKLFPFAKKDTSIPLDKFFKLIKPNYVYIKITPHKALGNHNSTNIAKAIALSYKSILKRIRREQKKLWVETNFKVSYMIDIVNKDANFYFIVPDCFLNVLVEKLKEIWGKATMEIVEPVAPLREDATIYQLTYKKLDALSLEVDKRTAEPLSQILSTLEVMEGNDRVTILYNFMPATQFGWEDRHNKTVTLFKENKPLVRNKASVEYILKNALSLVVSVLTSVTEVICDYFGGDSKKVNNSLIEALTSSFSFNTMKVISPETKRKKDLPILRSQIAVCSSSDDETRQYNNAMSACLAFRALDGDNELTYKKFKKKIDFEAYDIKTDINVMSTDECKNLIQLPKRDRLKELNIKHIKVEENPIPSELKKGYIRLGTVKIKGQTIEAFLEEHKEVARLPLMLLGRQGGGKTTFLCNYSSDCEKRNETVIHIDYIKNCEASQEIEESIKDKSKLIILDFSKPEGLQALAYNELKPSENATVFERLEIANKKAQLTIELMNSVNTNGEPLSNKMERFLMASANIVYLNPEATLRDVILCLQDHENRARVIMNIEEELREELEEDVATLRSLDEYSKGTKELAPFVCGTKENNITGILDRITLLKRDFYLKRMFNKNPKDNINFADAMRSGKVVLIRMPQSKFKDYVKNVITTFIVTKCWLSAEILGEVKDLSMRTHLIIDEISQAKTAELFMQDILTRTRKMSLKFVLTGQFLDQLEKQTIKQLKGAGTSFMLLKGAIKEDFEYFKQELDGTFEYEDLKDMEEYSSLNVVEYSKGKACFITKLPPELSKK